MFSSKSVKSSKVGSFEDFMQGSGGKCISPSIFCILFIVAIVGAIYSIFYL